MFGMEPMPSVMREKVVFLVDGEKVFGIEDAYSASFIDLPQKNTFVTLLDGKRYWVKNIHTKYVKINDIMKYGTEIEINLDEA